jgi:hypothetical protein
MAKAGVFPNEAKPRIRTSRSREMFGVVLIRKQGAETNPECWLEP